MSTAGVAPPIVPFHSASGEAISGETRLVFRLCTIQSNGRVHFHFTNSFVALTYVAPILAAMSLPRFRLLNPC
jgi:hypothetical protein